MGTVIPRGYMQKRPAAPSCNAHAGVPRNMASLTVSASIDSSKEIAGLNKKKKKKKNIMMMMMMTRNS